MFGGERAASILTIVAVIITYGVNPRAYLRLVTTLIINGWPNAKLRELLPDRLAVAHPELPVLVPSPRRSDHKVLAVQIKV